MKRSFCILAAGGILMLASCSAVPDNGLASEVTEAAAAEPSRTASTPEDPSLDTAPAQSSGLTAGTSVYPDIYEAYDDALLDVLKYYVLPDGTELEYQGPTDWIAVKLEYTDDYAVFDIDGDGREELIISFRTAPSAYHRAYIFEYYTDTHEWHYEGEFTPGSDIYDNGVIISYGHHANPRSTIMHYGVLRYDPESDTYETLGYVDSWGRDIEIEISGGIGDYPEEYDTDNAGVVYLLWGFDGTDEIRYYSQSAYEEFLEELYGDSETISIPYNDMVLENLDNSELITYF